MTSPLRTACRRLPTVAQAHATIAPDGVYRALTSEFDPLFYAQQLSLPIRRASERSRQRLLAHYITAGWREGMSPSPHFDAARYLADNPDVSAAGMEPLRHYLVHGRVERRAAFGMESPETQASADTPLARLGLTPDDVRSMAPWFDETFYRRAYPRQAQPGEDPLLHYLAQGWRQGHDPSAEFSTDHYLAANPDVQAKGVIPLLHFVRSGRSEGRPYHFVGSWRARLLAQSEGLDARARRWERPPPAHVLSRSELEAALAAHLGNRDGKPVVIALLQDRYLENVGGVQTCAQEEQRQFNGRGHAYVAISPYQTLPSLAMGEADAWLCDVSIDGRWVGTTRGLDMTEALARELQPRRSHLVVHSLLGHHVDWVARLDERIQTDQRLFWIHDYFSLCTGFNLLRNDVSACGAPPSDSDSCRLCLHGGARQAHLASLRALFGRVPFRVIAPSATALAIWTGATRLPHAGAEVLAHRRLSALPATRTARPQARSLRVAFVSQPAPHKGWFIFRDLVDSLRRDPRYAWYHLGAASDPHPQVTHVEVRNTLEHPDAMQQAVEKHEIDIALVLSQSPETFCLAAHEAVAGGAFVVALAGSGHVIELVRATAAGQVAHDEQQLLMAFRDGSLLAAADRYQAHRPKYDMQSSGISAGVFLARTEAGSR